MKKQCQVQANEWNYENEVQQSSVCKENDATPAKGKHSAIVFARCVCEEYGSTGNCLLKVVCATHSLKWLVGVQIVCVYRAVSLCYVTQTQTLPPL